MSDACCPAGPRARRPRAPCRERRIWGGLGSLTRSAGQSTSALVRTNFNPDAGLHARVVCLKDLRIDLKLDAEHQLRALVLRLDRLRRELRVGGDEADIGGNDVVGDGIKDDPARRQRSICRRSGGQEDGHDVGQVEDGDDRRSGRDDLAGTGELVLHPFRGEVRPR